MEEAESEEGAKWQISHNPRTVSVEVDQIGQGHHCSERYVSLKASVDDKRYHYYSEECEEDQRE
jgi:hypothetical protein